MTRVENILVDKLQRECRMAKSWCAFFFNIRQLTKLQKVKDMCFLKSYFSETIIKDKDVSTDQYLELVHPSFC